MEIVIAIAVLGFIALVLIPPKKAGEKKHKSSKKDNGPELYIKIDGKLYKATEVKEEKKPEKKERVPAAWRW